MATKQAHSKGGHGRDKIQAVCFVRGLCIATGQYSSFCGCAGVILLGGSEHMEDDDQDRGDEENGQKVETLEREEEVNERRNNERSDTW